MLHMDSHADKLDGVEASFSSQCESELNTFVLNHVASAKEFSTQWKHHQNVSKGLAPATEELEKAVSLLGADATSEDTELFRAKYIIQDFVMQLSTLCTLWESHFFENIIGGPLKAHTQHLVDLLATLDQATVRAPEQLRVCALPEARETLSDLIEAEIKHIKNLQRTSEMASTKTMQDILALTDECDQFQGSLSQLNVSLARLHTTDSVRQRDDDERERERERELSTLTAVVNVALSFIIIALTLHCIAF